MARELGNKPRVRVPNGFRAEWIGQTPIVVCWTCRRQWRVPSNMQTIGVLSQNAISMLVEHAEMCSPRQGRLFESTRRKLPRTGGYD